jgi:hypothetical protein
VTGRVVLLHIPDEDFAWTILDVASEQEDVARAVMVNADHAGLEDIFDPMRTGVWS